MNNAKLHILFHGMELKKNSLPDAVHKHTYITRHTLLMGLVSGHVHLIASIARLCFRPRCRDRQLVESWAQTVYTHVSLRSWCFLLQYSPMSAVTKSILNALMSLFLFPCSWCLASKCHFSIYCTPRDNMIFFSRPSLPSTSIVQSY